MESWRFVLAYFALMLGIAWCESNIIEGVCNWNASSGPKVIPASVFTVRFTACRNGRLVWRDPYGGVEITFRSGVPMTTAGTYRVCLTAKDAGTDIFTKVGSTLKRLRRRDDKNSSSELCVNSKTKKILIYFESMDKDRKESAVFRYRTSFQRSGRGLLRPKYCKLCGYEELVKSFCGGDFAVRGYVKKVFPIGGGGERGEAVVVASQVLHQSYEIFKKADNSEEFLSNINFPLYCHWKKRSKHGYLFTGSIKDGLGSVVRCRIKFSRWKRVYHKDICETMVVKT